MLSSSIFICLQHVISLLNENTGSINTPVVFLALFYPAIPGSTISRSRLSHMVLLCPYGLITLCPYILTPFRVRPCSLTTVYGTHMLVDAVVVLLHVWCFHVAQRRMYCGYRGGRKTGYTCLMYRHMSCSTRQIFAFRESSKLFCFVSLPCDWHTPGLGKLLNIN